ncbi:MAG: tRNA (5-methylaminomethyl-2-thiouridine)(34)-methyltransferase MnmD [Bacteroidales bacterium]|jgi:tRNA U34 5-methylaminomethyl-2-thiouridine-forming methyltransferase MnmC
MSNKLVTTSDGSHTLFVPELNEHFHSVNGAVQESMLVYIKNGFDFCAADPVHLLEIGFGTGLNALLTLMRSSEAERSVYYTAIEKYPLQKDLISLLNHSSFAGEKGAYLSDLIHSAAWNMPVKLTENFTLSKLISDFTSDQITGLFDLIYFDAFGPDKQPEMWSGQLFRKISDVTAPGGVFVTYSAKGTVKRALRSCGFDVSMLQGPPGKRQMIRAIKKDKLF